MRIVRFSIGDGPIFDGVVEGEDVVERRGETPSSQAGLQRAHLSEVVLHSPVSPSKLVCVGKNYMGHIAEMGFDAPRAPALFFKPPSSLIGHDQAIVLPDGEAGEDVEHEAELAVVIGKTARNVRARDAHDYILGYTCANDVSARNLQRADGSPVRAKSFDTFCPLGPWVETDVDGIGGLTIECRVNGEVRQRADSADVLFGVREIIEYASAIMTLEPNDVVLTGSPPGTTRLGDGNVVEIEIDGIGCLRSPVRAANG